jgi:pimeloyl-ACP methyl ester carboxylesterase
LIVALHWLGGSARTWQPLADRLAAKGLRCAALNLPGFGDAVDLPGYSVREMTDAACETVQRLLEEDPARPWLLAGHSMGGKIAALVARRALDGAPGLEGLCGMVMFSPSPPSPEPMQESTREKNLEHLGQSTGDAEEDRKRAQKFVTDNVGKLSLPPSLEDLLTNDLLRMNRAAFRAWMEHGSREDWRSFVGTLELPTLILAGEREAALGPDVQRETTLPHFPNGRVESITQAGHLLPLERPAEAVELILEFLATLGLLQPRAESLRKEFAALMDSEQTSEATREVLLTRLTQDESWHIPFAMSRELYRTLRALAETVVPHAGFDLAARVDSALTRGEGDGWRPATLPADAEAFHLGLRSLDAAAQHHHHGVSFLALDHERRNALLSLAAEGKLDGRNLAGQLHLGESASLFNAAQMKLWFEEVRGLLTRIYMADPRTYERVGFNGFADDPHGFTHIRLGETRA